MQLRKRTKKKREGGRLRSPSHLNFVRKHACLVDGCNAESIVAHHIGDTSTAAMGLKASDELTIPLCAWHHRVLHVVGERPFASEHDLDLREAAMWFAKRSPDQAIRETVKDAD